MKVALLGAAIVLVGTAGVAHAQSYTKNLPDSLTSKAKISEDSASKIAMKRMPNDTITDVTLERSKGTLVYAYDLKEPKKAGKREITVNAMTGKVTKNTFVASAGSMSKSSKAKKP
jgi:uncharacterized membrane protein YkoI